MRCARRHVRKQGRPAAAEGSRCARAACVATAHHGACAGARDDARGAGCTEPARDATFKAIRRATIVAARNQAARIVHLSIQRNHLHLLVEARDARALGEGMRRFAISAARQLNRVNRRRGRVFADRYHAELIDSPRQARHALAYVLNNWRRHDHDDNHVTRRWLLDRYASGVAFDGWRDVPAGHIWPLPRDYEPLIVQPATSWLLCIGWRQHGPIAMTERPARGYATTELGPDWPGTSSAESSPRRRRPGRGGAQRPRARRHHRGLR